MKAKLAYLFAAVLTILVLTAPVMAQSGGFVVVGKRVDSPALRIGDRIACDVVAEKMNGNVKMSCRYLDDAPAPTMEVIPSPTARATNTPRPTATRTPRPTNTPRPTATPWPTDTATPEGYPAPPTEDWIPYPTP